MNHRAMPLPIRRVGCLYMKAGDQGASRKPGTRESKMMKNQAEGEAEDKGDERLEQRPGKWLADRTRG